MMLSRLAARSSSTLTVVGVPTVECSQERNSRSITRLLTPHNGLVSSAEIHTILSYSYLCSAPAKSLIATCLARCALPQLSYAVIDLRRHTRHGQKVRLVACRDHPRELGSSVRCHRDAARPAMPIYRKTVAYGHFGNPDYTWEKPKQLVLRRSSRIEQLRRHVTFVDLEAHPSALLLLLVQQTTLL